MTFNLIILTFYAKTEQLEHIEIGLNGKQQQTQPETQGIKLIQTPLKQSLILDFQSN